MQADAAPSPPGAHPLTAEDPESVGAYRLLGRLGEGGMGAVYLGLSPTGQKVAVKVIRRELAIGPSFRARFATEVVNAQRVASFCTARVLDHGEADGAPFMVTEYIHGPSLADYVETHGGFPAGALRSLAVGVATALTAIHAVRLVHRDLKPRNVMLSASGPRVIDFGIARALDETDHHTRTGDVVGSPGWTAPELVFDGRISTAVDVFAWGTLIAYAAMGRHPYGTGNLPTLAARAQQGQYDLAGVPPELLHLVTAVLNPDPARRPSAENLLVQLVGATNPQAAATSIIQNEWHPQHPPSSPRTTVQSTRTEPSTRKRWPTWLVSVIAATATAVVVGAASAGAVALISNDDKPTTPKKTAPATSAKGAASKDFGKISRPCSLVSPALLEDVAPLAEVRPHSNLSEQDLTKDGAEAGCTWTAEKRSKSDPDTFGLKQLITSVKLRRDGDGRVGRTEAARDFAAARDKLFKKENTVEGGLKYGALVHLPGIGAEAYTMTVYGSGATDRNASAIVRIRLDNALVEVIYAFNYPANNKQTAKLDLLPRKEIAKQRAERAAREIVQSLTTCADCRV